MEQSSVLFTSSPAERLLQSTSHAGQEKVYWRTVQACPLSSTVYAFSRLFFTRCSHMLVILPGLL
jgi:hypothetical protein